MQRERADYNETGRVYTLPKSTSLTLLGHFQPSFVNTTFGLYSNDDLTLCSLQLCLDLESQA